METLTAPRHRGQHLATVTAAKAAKPAQLAFKRLEIGTVFTSRDGKFRKIGSRQAIRVKPNGIGETHAKLPFAGSTFCTPV